MKMLKDTKAVSPVIGIMLMLVVTVILAAAVSSTSTGLMKSTDPAPTAVFDVKVAKDVVDSMGYDNSYILIKMVTGDAIPTKDIKIVTTNPRAYGSKIREKLPTGEVKKYNHALDTEIGLVPYWNNAGMGYFGGVVNPYTGVYTPRNNADVNFGNYTLKPGISMTAQGGSTSNLGIWNATISDYDLAPGDLIGQMQDMFADWHNVSKGDFVNVKIVHMPTNKVIFASDVEVI